MNDFLAKPIDPESLKAVLARSYEDLSGSSEKNKNHRDDKKTISQSKKKIAQPVSEKISSRASQAVTKPEILQYIEEKDTQADKDKNNTQSTSDISAGKDQKTNTNAHEEGHHHLYDIQTLQTLQSHLERTQLLEMLEEVFEKGQEIITALEKAYQDQSSENIFARAHELKGMCGNFGLAKISAIASNIEHNARNNNLELISFDIGKLKTAHVDTQAAVQNWVETH